MSTISSKDDGIRMIDTQGSRSFEVDMKVTSPTLTPAPEDFKGGVKLVQSSNLQASFTLFKTFLGTGVLALPFAFKTAGLGLAIIVIIAVSLLTSRCFFLLLDVANDKYGMNRISLQKLSQEILGDKGKYAVQASMMIMQLGCCIGIIIFTRNFLDHVLCEFGASTLCNNTVFSIFFCLLLTVPLSMINNMHYFYIPSLAANFFILIGLLSQTYYNTQVIQDNPELKSTVGSHLKEFNWTQLPLFFGIATYAFEGVGVIFSIRSAMEKPQDFPRILKHEMILLTFIYLLFPTLCYIAFGSKVPDIIFFTLPTDDPFYLLIQVLYAISALFSYPVQLFPALRIMENSKFFRFKLFDEKGKAKNKKLRYGLRLVVIGLVFVVAYSANSFHLFLNLLGSCVFTFIGFILPVWVYNVQFKGRIKTATRFSNLLILAASIFFGFTGFCMSLQEMFKE